MSIYQNLLDTVGDTPIVELKRVVEKAASDLAKQGKHRFFAKLEYFNPGGSVKDRIAKAIVEGGERRGELKPGGTIIEATSGNTGLGLAMVAATRGYRSIFVMPEKISEEKRAILRGFGSEVVITPTGVEADDPRSHYSVARKLAREIPGGFLANQYDNPDNPMVHYETTGPEIWRQMNGDIDVFVAGAGTGGTLSGVGRFLKEKKKSVRIVCADPVGSILHDLFYYKEVRNPPQPYKVEGIGEDMLPKNVHFNVMDDFVQTTDAQAFKLCRELAHTEGIMVGPSAAAALYAAFEYARKLDQASRILILFPDHGSKYLSKAFNDEWLRENGLLGEAK